MRHNVPTPNNKKQISYVSPKHSDTFYSVADESDYYHSHDGTTTKRSHNKEDPTKRDHHMKKQNNNNNNKTNVTTPRKAISTSSNDRNTKGKNVKKNVSISLSRSPPSSSDISSYSSSTDSSSYDSNIISQNRLWHVGTPKPLHQHPRSPQQQQSGTGIVIPDKYYPRKYNAMIRNTSRRRNDNDDDNNKVEPRGMPWLPSPSMKGTAVDVIDDQDGYYDRRGGGRIGGKDDDDDDGDASFVTRLFGIFDPTVEPPTPAASSHDDSVDSRYVPDASYDDDDDDDEEERDEDDDDDDDDDDDEDDDDDDEEHGEEDYDDDSDDDDDNSDENDSSFDRYDITQRLPPVHRRTPPQHDSIIGSRSFSSTDQDTFDSHGALADPQRRRKKKASTAAAVATATNPGTPTSSSSHHHHAATSPVGGDAVPPVPPQATTNARNDPSDGNAPSHPASSSQESVTGRQANSSFDKGLETVYVGPECNFRQEYGSFESHNTIFVDSLPNPGVENKNKNKNNNNNNKTKQRSYLAGVVHETVDGEPNRDRSGVAAQEVPPPSSLPHDPRRKMITTEWRHENRATTTTTAEVEVTATAANAMTRGGHDWTLPDRSLLDEEDEDGIGSRTCLPTKFPKLLCAANKWKQQKQGTNNNNNSRRRKKRRNLFRRRKKDVDILDTVKEEIEEEDGGGGADADDGGGVEARSIGDTRPRRKGDDRKKWKDEDANTTATTSLEESHDRIDTNRNGGIDDDGPEQERKRRECLPFSSLRPIMKKSATSSLEESHDGIDTNGVIDDDDDGPEEEERKRRDCLPFSSLRRMGRDRHDNDDDDERGNAAPEEGGDTDVREDRETFEVVPIVRDEPDTNFDQSGSRFRFGRGKKKDRQHREGDDEEHNSKTCLSLANRGKKQPPDESTTTDDDVRSATVLQAGPMNEEYDAVESFLQPPPSSSTKNLRQSALLSSGSTKDQRKHYDLDTGKSYLSHEESGGGEMVATVQEILQQEMARYAANAVGQNSSSAAAKPQMRQWTKNWSANPPRSSNIRGRGGGNIHAPVSSRGVAQRGGRSMTTLRNTAPSQPYEDDHDRFFDRSCGPLLSNDRLMYQEEVQQLPYHHMPSNGRNPASLYKTWNITKTEPSYDYIEQNRFSTSYKDEEKRGVSSPALNHRLPAILSTPKGKSHSDPTTSSLTSRKSGQSLHSRHQSSFTPLDYSMIASVITDSEGHRSHDTDNDSEYSIFGQRSVLESLPSLGST